MANYTRPLEGFRFKLGGMKTNSSPDSLPPDKYAYVQNVRALTDSSVRTRPGSTALFSTPQRVTDLRSYSALNTDNLPRLLARNSADQIYLDNGALKGTLVGGGASPGAAMIPFRPNRSPNPYMYIANGSDYQKFSAPDAANNVVQKKAGIAEPQSAPDACPDHLNVFELTNADLAGSWANTGTAGGTSAPHRTDDTCVALFSDPASVAPSLATRYSMQVGTPQYQVGEFLTVALAGGGNASMVVQDVFPPVNNQVSLTILSIFYFAGNTGRCVLVPSQMPINDVVPQFEGENPVGSTLNSQQLISSLRRGSLVQLNPGGLNQETVFVLSVAQGPTGLVAIECSTANTHVSGEVLNGLPAIAVSFGNAPALLIGQAITSIAIQSAIGAGTGLLTLAVAAANNPFTHQGLLSDPSLPTPQQDDYVHISLNVSDLTKITDIQLQFDVGDGTFTQNFYYYDIQPSALVGAVAGTQTQLAATQIAKQQADIRANLRALDVGPDFIRNPEGANLPDVVPSYSINPSTTTSLGTSQWSEIMFPILRFTRVGADESKTLANVNSCRVQVVATGNITVQLSSLWVAAGGQADVGTSELYFYRVRPRDSRTGVIGNPSPATRYGIAPRRQRAIVSTPSAAYDAQIDTWDVFRFGGTVTTYRYIGSTPPGVSFVDNYFDDAALAGDALDFDNFEPWPSVDLPQNSTASKVNGTVAQVTLLAPTNALRWLPGTEVQLGGTQVFTLRKRPTSLGGTNYLFEFIECSPVGANVALSIPEPLLANQMLPYMWGPDTTGTVFACGDPLRPGTFSFCKNNNPDSCPDTYNEELPGPSTPVIGGELLDGVSYVSSPESIWALFPNAANPAQRWIPIQQPIPRGFAAPFGHCTDGQSIYFWAKDGIWSSSKGSLTDADLYNIFPHEGVPGRTHTYGAFTVQPPDYSRAGTFRLAYCNYYLFADYQDLNGNYHTLVLDTRRNAWCVDVYGTPVSVHYHPEQQEGTLLTSGTLYPLLIMGRTDGSVHKETDGTNDGASPIPCAIATMEWNGGDVRAGEQWGDMILDCFPLAKGVALTATPVVLGVQASAPNVFPASAVRTQEIVSLGGNILTNYLGLLCTWTDDFTQQADATRLEIWQPSLILKPETIIDRITDWYEPANGAAAFVQGFRMRADTGNAVKSILIRDADALATHAFTPIVQHNGEQKKAYSFNVPFIAHLVRIEGQADGVGWRLWEAEMEWIAESTPEQAETWTTQATSHGQQGYHHVMRIMAAWASTATVALTLTSFDGQSPQPIILPSTAGQFQKQLFTLTANKGVLYTYSATSVNPFQFYLPDFEIWVMPWRRQGGMEIYRNLGGMKGDKATV